MNDPRDMGKDDEDVQIVISDENDDNDTSISVGHRPDSDQTLWIGTSNTDGDCSWYMKKEEWEKLREAVDAAFLRAPRNDGDYDTTGDDGADELDPTDDNPIEEEE